MTIRDHHAYCDGCPSGRQAVVCVTAPLFDEWARLPMQTGGEAHLCPACRHKNARGWLAHEFLLECVRCGRNTVDDPGITKWWSTREQPGAKVCDDCHDSDRDATIL